MRLHAFPAYISRCPLVGLRSGLHSGLRSNHFGIRSSYYGLYRYRPISRPIFLVVRFYRFIHSFILRSSLLKPIREEGLQARGAYKEVPRASRRLALATPESP
jgi:hypothetical protein